MKRLWILAVLLTWFGRDGAHGQTIVIPYAENSPATVGVPFSAHFALDSGRCTMTLARLQSNHYVVQPDGSTLFYPGIPFPAGLTFDPVACLISGIPTGMATQRLTLRRRIGRWLTRT